MSLSTFQRLSASHPTTRCSVRPTATLHAYSHTIAAGDVWLRSIEALPPAADGKAE
jgi:hypothetical protein